MAKHSIHIYIGALLHHLSALSILAERVIEINHVGGIVRVCVLLVVRLY